MPRLAIILSILLTTASIHAAQVELQLVVHDQPDTTVDKMDRKRVIASPVSTPKGVEMKTIGIDMVCWARNVMLDGKPVFERYHEGKYIDRLPVARADLKPGEHTIWPGNHVFVIAKDGSISTKSPELLINGTTIRIKCYPVTLQAHRANPEEGELPASMRTAPLPTMTVRESANAEAAASKDAKVKALELLPDFEKFAPLCIWLPGNASGKGYFVHPLGLAFHLGTEGIKPIADAGKEIPGLKLQKNSVDIPLYGFPVAGEVGAGLIVTGVERIVWKTKDPELTNWYPRSQPYELKVAEDALPLLIDGDPRQRPFKAFRVDVPDPSQPGARVLAVELEKRHFDAGSSIRARIQVVDARRKGAEAAIQLGDKAAVIARVQAYGDNRWTDLDAKVATAGEVELALPPLANGIYRLQAGVKTENDEPLIVDRWISIAKPGAGGIGLFTHRGRTVFQRGENFWVGLGAVGLKEALPAGTSVEVDFIDASGRRLAVLKQPSTAALGEKDTLIVRFDGEQSLGFASGTYNVEAKVGPYAARPLPIQIVEAEPTTHFTNLITAKYNPQGKAYADVLKSGEGADALARSIAEMGHNSFKGLSYSVNRVIRNGLDIEQVARERPELGPWESYYQPSGRDRFVDAAVRHRLRFYEDILTYNDTMLPRDPKILEAISRYTSLETSSLRHNPAFKGICLYDEIYSVADTGTPMSAQFLTAEELTYRAKHPGYTSADALRALERYATRPFGQRKVEDLLKFKTWPAHEDSEWRGLSEIMARTAKTVMPDSQNFTLHRFWGSNGGNLSANGVGPDVFAPLDAAACVMYKDGGYGDRPVFAPMQADVLRVRDNLPVWTQLHTFHAPGIYGKHLLRQAFFAISQKIDGLTYFSIDADHISPSSVDNRDAMHDISRKLCTQYGDLFISLQKGYKKVGIYYSREAEYLETRKPNSLTHACEGLWVACMRAGFPADYLFDHSIREGKGGEYDVIFAPGFYFEDEASPEILAALRKLVNSGKIVAVEKSSKLPIDGIHRLESEFDEYDDKFGGAFPRNVDFESEMVWDQSNETTKLVREFLAKHIPPAAVHSLLVGPDWLRRGKTEYMVIPNFAFTGFTGLHKTLYQAPDRPTLRFPKRPPVCYDMLEMKRVDVATDGDWMSLQADLAECPGKIYAFVPSEIGGVELKCSLQAATNSDINYHIAVCDREKQAIDGAFPIHISILDAKGTVLHEIFRAASPAYAGVYRLPANVASGGVTLKVRELVSGRTAEAKIVVTAGTDPLARIDDSKVRIGDAGLIKQVLAARQPVVIAVDDEQIWCKEEASRLAAGLEKMGIAVRVATVDSIQRLPADWNDKALVVDGSRLWRGEVVEPGLIVDSALILIGKRYDNRLIESLVHRGAMAEAVSENFPGRGRALLGCVHKAFSNQYDTITLQAIDEAGLRQGVDALLNVEALVDTHPIRPVVKQPKPDPAAELRLAQTTSDDPLSFTASLADLDHVQALTIEPASGRIVVGTFGYGHNLFCFSADGKLLWKQFLPEHNVYSAQWYDGGKRIVAATGMGNFLFLLDAENGTVLRRMKTSEWPQYHYTEGAVNTQSEIVINSPLKQILVRGLTGIFALDYDGKKLWSYDRAEAIASYPESAEQTKAAAFNSMVQVGNIALNPGGSRIAYSEMQIVGSTEVMRKIEDLWGHRPKVLDAATGKVLLENGEDGGSSVGGGGWSVSYDAGLEEPQLHHGGFSRAFKADGKLGPVRLGAAGDVLSDGAVLVRTPMGARRIKAGADVWRIDDGKFWLRSHDRRNEKGTRLYRCSWDGLVCCIDLANGKALWQRQLQSCAHLRPLAGDSDRLVVGGKNGAVMTFDADGAILWQTRIRDHHTAPTQPYSAYIATMLKRDADSSGAIFPLQVDVPGDLDSTLRMGIEQLANGDFESGEAWQADSGGIQTEAPGHSLALPGKDEGKSLALSAGRLVTQRLNRRVIPSATYLLEFMYRTDDPGARLVAGVLMKGAKETLTASKYEGTPGEWRFGRLAVKTYDGTASLEVGFEAEGGAVRVDKASLRAIRFPSANLLANSELHQIEPTFVKDIRVRYSKIPSTLRDKLMNRNHVTAYKQGESTTAQTLTQEASFLQNGRLDDVGQMWTYMPDAIGFSMTLTKPAHVSDVVIYLNNATPANVYSTIAVLANCMDAEDASGKPQKISGVPKLMALVRGNTKRFVVVHFPTPVLTDSIKILPGKHPGKKECITEIELYGPLGGNARGKTAVPDPLERPMFMGNPTHVPAALPADVVGEYQALPNPQNAGPVFHAGAALFDGLFAFGDPNGGIRSIKLLGTGPRTPPEKGKKPQPERAEQGLAWPLASVSPTTTPAHFAGRIFVGSADGKMHAVADNGTYLWGFTTGGRVYSSPAPSGDDVYFGSDDGKLYKIDVDSGALIWEFATGGKVRGAPALADGRVIVSSGDGSVYAVASDSGMKQWAAPVAKHTRASPALANGNVYIGDETGGIHCFDAATGASKWKHAVKGYVSDCAVVTPEGAFFVSETGGAIFVSLDGKEMWKRELGVRVTGQAMATQTQILVPSERGLIVLRRADGKDDERFVAPEKSSKVVAVAVHASRLYLATASATTDYSSPPRTYVKYSGGAAVWVPKNEDSK